MKEKDLVCFYKIFANLYGAILDSDAFDIIKRFYPDFTYEEFHKDLKKRTKKFINFKKKRERNEIYNIFFLYC